MKEKIKCTVGILTFNSENTLERALRSLTAVDDIVVCDGGSTDSTRSIAQKFGARIIEQDPRYKDATGRLINYAGVRNQCVDAAHHDWFFYIDSDEIASTELIEDIRAVVDANPPPHLVYWVRFCLTSEDGSVVYKKFKEYYQPRFFNRRSGARFERPIHERVMYDTNILSAGRIEGAWYVPTTDEDFSFSQYYPGGSAWERLLIQAGAWRPRGSLDIGNELLLRPLKDTGKSLIRLLVVRLRYGNRGIPTRYELLKICSAWVSAYMRFRQLWK